MSDTQRSAVALRTLIVGEVGSPSVTNAADSLAGINTAELPDGASAFVLSTRSLYRLNKQLVQASAAPAFVASASGPGCWIFESGGTDGSPFGFQGLGTASLTGSTAMTVNQWAALPSGSLFYSTPSSGTPFTLNTTTGIITYSGPNLIVLVSATATLSCATAAQAMEFAITRNGFSIGTTGFDGTAGAASSDPTTANLGACISTKRILTLVNNDTIQTVMRNTTGTPGNLNATHLNLLIEAA